MKEAKKATITEEGQFCFEVEDYAEHVQWAMKRYLCKMLKSSGRSSERAGGSCEWLEDFCVKSAPGGYIPIFITHNSLRHIRSDTTLDEAAGLVWTMGPERLGRSCVAKGSRPYFDKKHFSPRLL